MGIKDTKIYQLLINMILKKSCLFRIEEAYKVIIVRLDEFEIQYNWLYMEELRDEVSNEINTELIRKKINDNYNILIELIEIYSQIKQMKYSDFKLKIYEINKDVNYQENKNILNNFLLSKKKYFK